MAALAMLAAGELLVRRSDFLLRLSGGMKDTFYGVPFAVTHLERVQKLREAARAGGGGAVVVSSSGLASGIDWNLLSPELREGGERCDVVALPGAGVPIEGLANVDLLIAARPRVVVIGVTVADFYFPYDLATRAAYFVSPRTVALWARFPAERMTPVEKRALLTRGLLGHAFWLVRYRSLVSRFMGRPDAPPEWFGPRGLASRPETPYMREALRELLGRLDAAGIRAVVVDMPTRRVEDPGARELVREHDLFLASLARNDGVSVVARSRLGLRPSELEDGVHVPSRDKSRFTREVFLPLLRPYLPGLSALARAQRS